MSDARKLTLSLSILESDPKMKAKERRSAKRRAEAIASEELGRWASELLIWYEENGGGG